MMQDHVSRVAVVSLVLLILSEALVYVIRIAMLLLTATAARQRCLTETTEVNRCLRSLLGRLPRVRMMTTEHIAYMAAR